MATPKMMRVWQYEQTKGGIEKHIKLNKVPVPDPKADEHLVKIQAVSLNPVDVKLPESVFGPILPGRTNTLALDFSGIVVKPASGSGLKIGQRVFGLAGLSPWTGRALAEYAAVPKSVTVDIPDGVSSKDAATIGTAGLTTLQAMKPKVKSGDKVFINGGSGGTGVYGIQIAKALGCSVTTSCSTRNVELCRSLGADDVVDYTKVKLPEALKGRDFDSVFDNVGGDTQLYWQSHKFTKPTAIYTMIGGTPSVGNVAKNMQIKFSPFKKRTYTGFFPQPDSETLKQIIDWMAEGKVRAVIDSTFPFEDASKAIESLKTGRSRGKIVIDVALDD